MVFEFFFRSTAFIEISFSDGMQPEAMFQLKSFICAQFLWYFLTKSLTRLHCVYSFHFLFLARAGLVSWSRSNYRFLWFFGKQPHNTGRFEHSLVESKHNTNKQRNSIYRIIDWIFCREWIGLDRLYLFQIIWVSWLIMCFCRSACEPSRINTIDNGFQNHYNCLQFAHVQSAWCSKPHNNNELEWKINVYCAIVADCNVRRPSDDVFQFQSSW